MGWGWGWGLEWEWVGTRTEERRAATRQPPAAHALAAAPTHGAGAGVDTPQRKPLAGSLRVCVWGGGYVAKATPQQGRHGRAPAASTPCRSPQRRRLAAPGGWTAPGTTRGARCSRPGSRDRHRNRSVAPTPAPTQRRTTRCEGGAVKGATMVKPTPARGKHMARHPHPTHTHKRTKHAQRTRHAHTARPPRTPRSRRTRRTRRRWWGLR